ncbi:MAG: Gfo/Idh/MocA family oxidoreductase [Limnohabitans sp.]|nr:Gfo/Idh/MocA family oxidoreductase [Limnohabitans sp.]
MSHAFHPAGGASRREFLRTSALVTAAATVGLGASRARSEPSLPANTTRNARLARPLKNGRLQIGVVGWGIRAREIYGFFLDDPNVEIVAIADVVDARAAEGVRLIEERRKNGSARLALSWRDVVADPAVDAVIVTTHDAWHAEPAIAASLAGKHVYCEKPLSLTIAEGRAIASAARAGGVRFQVGSQQRSEYGHMFVRAAEAVRNGRIGRVTRITIGVGAPPKSCDLPDEALPPGIDWDGWLGQAPERGFSSVLCPIGVHRNYPAGRNYREYANGGLADMGAHHFDIAQWALNMDASGPREVVPPPDGAVTGLRFVYPNGVEMIHGGPTDCTFIGDEGTIEVSRGHLRAYRSSDRTAPDAPEILAEPTGNELRLPRNSSHAADFLSAIREGRDPICTAETGHRTATVCQLANIGYALRQPLVWNAANELFEGANASTANALVTRTARKHR